MVNYFRLVSAELLIKLNQIKEIIKKHNPTTGLLAEEILRSFLKCYLPKSVSVEQGFVLSKSGKMSKQCDILIYDSHYFAPIYRINDIVVVPSDSVIAVIEVKTTITKSIFHDTISYFQNISAITNAKKYLFIYNSCKIDKLEDFFHSYVHKKRDDNQSDHKGFFQSDSQNKEIYQNFDHGTYDLLPDEITGISYPLTKMKKSSDKVADINNSYHLKKDYVIYDREEKDTKGYSSFFYENEKGTEVNALQVFYLSVYESIEIYHGKNKKSIPIKSYFGKNNFKSYFAFGLFDT